MPERLELDLALAGLALARNWLVGEPATIQRIVAEVRRLAALPPAEAFPAPRRDTGDGYADWAATYDRPGNWIVERDSAVVGSLLATCEPGDALDAACGTGRHARLLHEQGHRVIGVDASSAMLAKARARLPSVDLRQGDLRNLPLPAGSVDLVVCSLALTHLPDLAAPVSEFARVLRSGGRLIISDVHPCHVMLGAQAGFRDGEGRFAYVVNHLHWHSSYLDAFRASGFAVNQSADVAFTDEMSELVAAGLELSPDVVAQALTGFPAIVVWDLTRS
jgi:SAM-dependent methyltransferase